MAYVEHSIIKQKSRIKWESYGESNSKFFQKMVQYRLKKGHIHGISSSRINGVKILQILERLFIVTSTLSSTGSLKELIMRLEI